MNVVMGMTELLADEAVSSQQLENIKSITANSKALLTIIDGLLDFSRIEDGSFRLNPENYCLPAMLENVTNISRAMAEQKGLVFIAELPAGLPEYIHGDAAKLQQALMNLLSNAVKFTDKGEVALSLRVVDDSVLEFMIPAQA
jgi:signal transduction histidine kinase